MANPARIDQVNPAILSSRLRSLFSPGAAAAILREPGDPGLLLPEEAEYLGRAIPERAREFAAGRLCARRALAEFGIVDFPVRVGDDRQPVWPDSLAGSITHTTGFCAAVVAERRRVAALGLDSEVVGDIRAELWPRICLPVEIAWVRSVPAAEQAAAVTLIFSAKEAFYKCQYPLARERLNFHDVSVEAPGWGAAEGAFRIQPARSIAIAAQMPLPMQGRYLFHERFVTAGMEAGTAVKVAARAGSVQ
jgi:4'-phosphopantetheinyl transferase EntD